jgi:Zn-dependent M28 family amino/carboxypeptidase
MSLSRKQRAIPGANDGGSGVAVLLELATVLRNWETTSGICLIFFDGEDYGFANSSDHFCYGSKFLAEHQPPVLKPIKWSINLDMVGDKDLRLKPEGYSLKSEPDFVLAIWEIGMELYPEVFEVEMGPYVFDDHVPLLQAGIRAINIIDFEYPAWHTMSDDVSQCSPQSLKVVGDVILQWLSESGL